MPCPQNVRFLLWSPLGSALWIGVAGLAVWTVHRAASALITQTCGRLARKSASSGPPPATFQEKLSQWWIVQKARLANVDTGLGGWFDFVFSVAHFYILSRVYMVRCGWAAAQSCGRSHWFLAWLRAHASGTRQHNAWTG